MITQGDTAPEFTLPGTDGDDITDYSLSAATEDGPVVLAFYVFDFHPACTEEVCSIRDLSWFEFMAGTDVLAISTDSVYSHRAFAREHNIEFPLLSDSDGSVSESYDALYDELNGHRRVSKRAVFVVDGAGEVRYAWRAADPGMQPDWDAIKGVLESL